MECDSRDLFSLLKLVNDKAGTLGVTKGNIFQKFEYNFDQKIPPNEDKFYLKKCIQHLPTSMNGAAGNLLSKKTSK